MCWSHLEGLLLDLALPLLVFAEKVELGLQVEAFQVREVPLLRLLGLQLSLRGAARVGGSALRFANVHAKKEWPVETQTTTAKTNTMHTNCYQQHAHNDCFHM